MIVYTSTDLQIVKKYKVHQKVNCANKRFDDKICTSDVLNLLKRFDFTCCYCGDKLLPESWQLDHFYARAMGGKNKIHNLASSCKWCNLMKNGLDGHAFIEKCKKVIQNNLIQYM